MTTLARSTGMLTSSVAPMKAPTAPGSAMVRTTRQSTLPKEWCEMPEAAVVPSWASCTMAEAMAGLVPIISSSVVEVTP